MKPYQFKNKPKFVAKSAKGTRKTGQKKLFWILLLTIIVLFTGVILFVNLSIRSFEAYRPGKIRKEFAQANLPEPISAEFLASPLPLPRAEPDSGGQPQSGKQGAATEQNPYRLHYYLSEDLHSEPSKPILYLIHGGPGTAVNFLNESYFLNKTLRKRYVLLAVDRPGYGFSQPGQAVPQFARAIQPMIEQLQSIKESFPQRQIFGLGWSFGGPLLALIAERSSQDPDLLVQGRQILNGAILVATPADPAQEKFWWFNPLLQYRFLNWMFSSSIRVANIEKMAHPAELEKMREAWSHIRIPVAYLQGSDDEIVFPGNIEFLRQQARKQTQKSTTESRIYEIPGGGHGIVFTEVDLIESILNSWL